MAFSFVYDYLGPFAALSVSGVLLFYLLLLVLDHYFDIFLFLA